MGVLFYGAARHQVEFDDRALAHLQLVMTVKLRRAEGFMLSWSVEKSDGSGRAMVWVHPQTDLHFVFSGGRAPEINRDWVDQLVLLSNTPGGLQVTREGDLKPLQPAL